MGLHLHGALCLSLSQIYCVYQVDMRIKEARARFLVMLCDRLYQTEFTSNGNGKQISEAFIPTSLSSL